MTLLLQDHRIPEKSVLIVAKEVLQPAPGQARKLAVLGPKLRSNGERRGTQSGRCLSGLGIDLRTGRGHKKNPCSTARGFRAFTLYITRILLGVRKFRTTRHFQLRTPLVPPPQKNFCNLLARQRLSSTIRSIRSRLKILVNRLFK